MHKEKQFNRKLLIYYGLLPAIISPFVSSVATIFKTGATKTVKGWIVSTLRYVGPILGAPVAYFLLKETLTLNQIFGAAIVVATSFLIVREHIRSK